MKKKTPACKCHRLGRKDLCAVVLLEGVTVSRKRPACRCHRCLSKYLLAGVLGWGKKDLLAGVTGEEEKTCLQVPKVMRKRPACM